MKLIVVEEQRDAQEDIVRLCDRNDDVQVIGRLGSGMEAIEAAYALKPDVMLINTQ
jgi:chemotaxis response regulator CheB